MLFQSQTTAEPIAAIRRLVIPVLSYDQLFFNPQRSAFVAKFASLSKLNPQQFESVYLSTIKNYAEFVQLIPCDKRGVWGSLLDRGLMRAEFALSHIDQADEDVDDSLFRYALFSAALYMDLGKIIAQHDIYFCAENGELKEPYQPFDQGSFVQEKFYRIFPKNESLTKLCHLVTPILARQICPEACFLWLAQDLKLLADWLSLLQGDFGDGGILGKILALVKLEDEKTHALTENILPRVEFEPRVASGTKIADEFLDWLAEKMNLDEKSDYGDWKIYHDRIWLNILVLQRLVQEFVKQKPQYKNWQTVLEKIMALPMISSHKNPVQLQPDWDPKAVLEKRSPEDPLLPKNQKMPWFEPRQKGTLKSMARVQNLIVNPPLQSSPEQKILGQEKKIPVRIKQEIPTRMVSIPMHLIYFGSMSASVIEKRNLEEAEQKMLEKMMRKENKNEKSLEKFLKRMKIRGIISHYLKKH